MNHIIQQIFPACGHNRNSKLHFKQRENCSRIKKKMREAGDLPDQPLDRRALPTIPDLRAGSYGTQSRSYRE